MDILGLTNHISLNRALQSNVSGLDPINVTGTVQDAWKHINQTWPGYQLPQL